MPINFMSGLMAGANFGTGYLQGQQTANQIAFNNKINQLNLDDAMLRDQQQRLSMQQQQALSDKAMQLWNPSAQSQPNPVPPAQFPDQQTSQPQQTPDKMEQLADFAEIAGIEFLSIDSGTRLEDFRKELKWNDVYYFLAQR